MGLIWELGLAGAVGCDAFAYLMLVAEKKQDWGVCCGATWTAPRKQ